MPADSKRTPALVERITAMYRKGASSREIGTAVGITHTTIIKWLRSMNLEPHGGAGAREKRKRKVKPPGEDGLALAVAEIEAELEKPGASRELLRRRHAQISKTLNDRYEQFVSGEFNGSLYERLLEQERKLAVQVAQLEPAPTPADGEIVDKDATDLVVSKLRRLVEKAEKAERCANCGNNPYRSVG